MGANTIQVPLLSQKCKRRDLTHVTLSKTPDNVRLVKKTRHASLPLLVQLFFLLCSVWMVCVVVGGRPVPGSHPSSRHSYGELTQSSESPAGCSVPPAATRVATGPANTTWFQRSIIKLTYTVWILSTNLTINPANTNFTFCTISIHLCWHTFSVGHVFFLNLKCKDSHYRSTNADLNCWFLQKETIA